MEGGREEVAAGELRSLALEGGDDVVFPFQQRLQRHPLVLGASDADSPCLALPISSSHSRQTNTDTFGLSSVPAQQDMDVGSSTVLDPRRPRPSPT